MSKPPKRPKDDAARKAKAETARKAKAEAKKDAEKKAKLAAEKGKLEARKKAKLAAEKKAKREAARKKKLAAEQKAEEEAARKAKLEAAERVTLEAQKLDGLKKIKGQLSARPTRFTPKPAPKPRERPTLKPGAPLPKLPTLFKTRAKAFDDLRAQIPVLMFPVRLETRFTAAPNRHLRLRVYPDQVSIDGLQRGLTEAEIQRGKETLDKLDSLAPGSDAARAVWSGFASGADAARAAWILRALQSKKVTKAKGENTARAPLLPDRWFVTGYVGGTAVFNTSGGDIPRDLAVSPDLSGVVDAETALASDPALGWMFDFNKAVSVGMALDIALPDAAQGGIDELYVLGVLTRDPGTSDKALTPARGASLLERHLEALHYDWGGGFVPVGTATNNTGDSAAGWSAFAPDLDGAYQRELLEAGKNDKLIPVEAAPDQDQALRPRGPLIGASEEEMNFHRLARALGLGGQSVLRRFEHREGNETSVAQAMNTVLWQVTWGELMTPLLQDHGNGYFSEDTVNWLRNWFRDAVTGGAMLPAIRVGATPYGVLPATPFAPEPLTQSPRNPGDLRMYQMRRILHTVLTEWHAASANVLRLSEAPPDLSGFDGPGERLLEILRQAPNPASFAQSEVESQTGLNVWYEFLNLAVSPLAGSPLVRDLFDVVYEGETSTADAYPLLMALAADNGFAPYREWPASFSSGQQQIELLTEKRNLLQWLIEAGEDLEAELEDGIGDFAAALVAGLISQAVAYKRDDYLTVIGYLDQMIALCAEHQDRNHLLKTVLQAPGALYSGVLGDSSHDPALAYLGHDPARLNWPAQAHVGAVGDAGLAPEVWLEMLIGFAQSLKNGTPAPPEPAFPNNDKPLLYTLMREAIRRTGTDPDPNSEGFSGLSTATTPEKMTARLRAMEPAQMSALAARLNAIRVAPQGARVARGDAALLQAVRDVPSTRFGPIGAAMVQVAQQDAARTAQLGVAPTIALPQAQALAQTIAAMGGLAAGGHFTTLRAPAAITSRAGMLNQIITALQLLKGLSPAQLQLVMCQTLGLASWRIDAWISALAKQRLDGLRTRDGSKNGIQIGAFGWVENLVPNAPKAEAKAHEKRSQGYIHAPSLTHAKTAAILRAGWNSYGSDDAAAPFATDLSSARMRDAKWHFEAIRQGQDLGDLLGVAFERALQEAGAQVWIAPMRAAVLKLSGQPPAPEHPVIDGLELHQLAQAGHGSLEQEARNALSKIEGAPANPGYGPVKQAIARLEDAFDSMADAALAESVHALVQGNALRAGSALSAIGDGSVPPPQMDILETAPPGQTLTHKVAIFAPTSGGWVTPDFALSPRAYGDPDMEALVAHLLGRAKDLAVDFDWLDAGGAVLSNQVITWADMGRGAYGGGALDLLHLLPPEGDIAADSALGRRIMAHLVTSRYKAPPTAERPVLRLEGPQSGARRDLLARWAAWRAVLMEGRALAPRDLALPAENAPAPATPDLAAFERRAGDLRDELITTAKPVLRALPARQEGTPKPVGTTPAATLEPLLAKLARFGFDSALPADPAPTLETVYARVWALAPKLGKLAQSLGSMPLGPSVGDDVARLTAARAVMQAVFGKGYHATLRITPSQSQMLNGGFAQAQARRDEAPGEAYQWLEKMGYVRPPLRALSDALTIEECFTGTSPSPLSVAQWPDAGRAPWIALSPALRAGGARLSMLALHPGAARVMAKTGGLAGLILDEVVDKLPATHSDSGVALHFDAPNTSAPQSLLLAMPPEGKSWDYETMLATLRDTFALARARAVDSNAMPDFNQVLPAIFGPPDMHPGGTS